MFDGENISFDATLVIYINSTNIPPIMIINRIYEHQNPLSLQLVSFLVGSVIANKACIHRDIPATDAVLRDTTKETLRINFKVKAKVTY